MFKNSTILITGGTGSWGQELTRQLLRYKPKEIRIFSRNEFSQVTMKRTFQEDGILKFTIGDIRDFHAVQEACRNVDYVFHLAALKHVPICEWQPQEAIKTNIAGTENIIRASIQQGVKKVIDVSTDKAADPINFYGMTKAIGEKLVIRANDWNTFTRFVCIRGGNVLGTNGSVVPFFKKQILEGQDVTITSREMTRFFLTIAEAIDLLLHAAQAAMGGETFVMKMNSCRILDLANILIGQFAAKSVQIREIGIRPGEKLHEVLVTRYETPNTYQFNEKYFVILPSHSAPELFAKYKDLKKVSFETYESNTNLMSGSEIEKLLRRGGVLH
ncbi:polysaccharide biosynthesis protein [Fodinisporobacter ferrooxydans]|uniref:Polysaccharide biosynthesis protein n=1 Tax=Fodinisporobacter ferrooxydans TaxID=2901836 RepID=A0ABY4CJ55_9BACL|nr:polysaccharide biosynthesis protein [Alicyclobacillaceae bacterium MYW30-H2]